MRIDNGQEVINIIDEIRALSNQIANTFVKSIAENDIDDEMIDRLYTAMKTLRTLSNDVIKEIHD